jgi:DNA-binding NarL/FixJ family response regulator
VFGYGSPLVGNVRAALIHQPTFPAAFAERVRLLHLPLEQGLQGPSMWISYAPVDEIVVRKHAQRILDALLERKREVLRLRFLQGYTAEEISRSLGLTAGKVRVSQLPALCRAPTPLDPEHGMPPETIVKES